MKKDRYLIKRNSKLILIFSLFFLIVTPSFSSDTLNFVAKRYRTNSVVSPDSIRIFNTNNDKELILKKNIISKKEILSLFDLTGVEDNNPSIAFSNNNLIFYNNSNYFGKANLKIYNYIGVELLNRDIEVNGFENYIDLPKSFQNGIYFAVIDFNSKIFRQKISLTDENIKTVIKSDKFIDVYGYYKNQKQCYVSRFDFENLDTLNLMFYDNSKYQFRTGKVTIDSLLGIKYISSTYGNGSGSNSSYNYDTSYLKHSFELGLMDFYSKYVYMNEVLCNYPQNNLDTINFCIGRNTGSNGYIAIRGILIVDDKLEIIKNAFFEYLYKDYSSDNGGGYSSVSRYQTNISNEFKDIPFEIDFNGNIIVDFLLESNNIKSIKGSYIKSWTQNAQYSDYSWDIKSWKLMPNKTRIKIELIK